MTRSARARSISGASAGRARSALVLALALVILPTGCVTRRFVITSDPPGALVYRDGQPIGATPVEQQFVYYGKYSFRLVKDGFEPLDVEPEFRAPWYEYPFIDFVSENIIPYTYRDVQVFHFALQPATRVPPEQLRTAAEILRARGLLVQPPPGIIVPPRQGPRPVVPPQTAPPPPAPPRPPPALPLTPSPVPSGTPIGANFSEAGTLPPPPVSATLGGPRPVTASSP